MSEPIELNSDNAMSFIEATMNQAIGEIEAALPQLGHGQKTRLLQAIARYPILQFDFSDDGEDMIKAYSAFKILVDSQVNLGIELVEQGKKEAEEQNNG